MIMMIVEKSREAIGLYLFIRICVFFLASRRRTCLGVRSDQRTAGAGAEPAAAQPRCLFSVFTYEFGAD